MPVTDLPEYNPKREEGFGCCDYFLIGLSYILLAALFPIAVFSAIKVITLNETRLFVDSKFNIYFKPDRERI